jgi:hypothetical protein
MPPIPVPPPPPPPSPNPKPPLPDIMQGLLIELNWSSQLPFVDLDLTLESGNGTAVGGPLNATFLPPPAPNGAQHGGNKEADSRGIGQEKVTFFNSYPQDFYLARVELRNSAPVSASIIVKQDPGGPNEQVIGGVAAIALDPSNPFFQVHIPAPANLPSPPPPLPPPPVIGPLPPPQAGPDNTNPMLGSSPRSAPARSAKQRHR